jgi:hypothetical protein
LFKVGAEFIKFLTHFDAAVLRAFLFLVFFIDLVSIMESSNDEKSRMSRFLKIQSPAS